MKLSLGQLVADVMNLNTIIRFIDTSNCYEKIVSFFRITRELQDHSEEFKRLLPRIEGFKFCKLKSEKRKKSEAIRHEMEMGLKVFLHEINKVEKNSFDINKTEFGKKITKDNIFFGNIWGIPRHSIREFEEDLKDDTFVQERIRDQILNFVKHYENSFDLDWLKYAKRTN
jgi:hypothetical protein